MFGWIAVGVGGALGSMARHGINRFVLQQWPTLRFPAATIIINIVGCCVIGALAGLAMSGRLPIRLVWREFIFVGILGGFTTFSTFGLETATLLRAGHSAAALSNVAIQVLCGVGGVYLGLIIFERLGVTTP